MYEVKQKSLMFVAAGVLSAMVATGCGDSKTPTTPAPVTPSGSTTLKVSAPSIVSPSGGTSLSTRTPTLIFRPAQGAYGSPSVSYEVQVLSTAGDTVYSRTSYRWRARAVQGSNTGPWSDGSTTGPAMFVTNGLSPGSSNAEFREFFFSLIAQKGLAFPTQQAFIAMDADLTGVGIIVAKDSSGFIRGRIYLPTGGADKYARSVDVITGFGPEFRWVWNERGRTVCEGICP